jgi:hypothetical protein
MIMLGSEPQKKNVDLNGNIWTQLSGQSYNKYLQLSSSIFSMKMGKAYQNTELSQSLHPDAQEPIDGFSVCETKFIISELIGRGVVYNDLSDYTNKLNKFSSNCTQADKDYYYDFRGDSNFKHYSPESNAMLWQAISIARFCASPTKSNGKSARITDSVCENYFKRPFLTRYSAAKSGLAAWLLYEDSADSIFSDANSNVTVLPSFNFSEIGYKPFRMMVGGSEVKTNISILGSDLNFNEEFSVGKNAPALSIAYERLRNAVNRHTNWYASSYDDQLGHEKSRRDQAYSPFVASSYEMSQSNQFTECGITVACDGDGRKAWMLVFRVHKNNWYNTRSLKNNQRIDFDRMWFDETSFGTDRLADSERAWDRMGTALEDELDSILYLHNLGAGTGVPVANDTLD